MMSYLSMLSKMNPSWIKKVGDDATTVVPLAEKMQQLELNTLQLRTDNETCDET